MKLWQSLADNWSKLVFKERYKDINPKIRALRALEEMMELSQAENVTEEEVLIILRQVYDKPKGDPHQELGGVMTCLAAYGATSGLDMEECFLAEYMRICDPVVMEKVRKRNLEGDKIGFDKSNEIKDNAISNSGSGIPVKSDKDTLSIQVGKTYSTRAGGAFYICEELDKSHKAYKDGYRFVADGDLLFKANGKYLENEDPCEYDLIKEMKY